MNELVLRKPEIVEEKKPEAWKPFLDFLKQNLPAIGASVLSINSLLLFLIIGFPEFFEPIPYFSQRYFSLIFIGFSLIFSYLLAFLSGWSLLKIIGIWLQSNILLLMSFFYYVRLELNNSYSLPFVDIMISNKVILIPLVALIFIINYNLFGKYLNKMRFILPQIFLFTIQIYAFLSVLQTDSTEKRSFSIEWLGWIFSIDSIWWIAFASIAITIVSTLILKLENKKNLLAFSGLFAFLVFQALLSIYFFKIDSYWWQTILFLIVWDYIYPPFITIIEEKKDSKFNEKFLVSTAYHIFLFLVVIIVYNL